MVAGGTPQIPQRPIPAVQHVWVAAPGAAQGLYRGAMLRVIGPWRIGVYVTMLVFAGTLTALDPARGIPWLIGLLVAAVLLAVLLWRRGRTADMYMRPGSVWASGFGANEMLIITPASTTIVDYTALGPPRDTGHAILVRIRRGSTLLLPRELIPPAAFAYLQQRTS